MAGLATYLSHPGRGEDAGRGENAGREENLLNGTHDDTARGPGENESSMHAASPTSKPSHHSLFHTHHTHHNSSTSTYKQAGNHAENILDNVETPNASHSQTSEPLLQNTSNRPWIVQKFGGTSVGKEPVVIAEDIVREWTRKHRVAVICSARSSDSKLDGTTNRLLRAAHAAENPAAGDYTTIIDAIRDDHIRQAKTLLHSSTIADTLNRTIYNECHDLVGLLEAAQRLGEVSPGTMDMVISKGEKLSCHFMTALLRDRGVDAQYVDLSTAITFGTPAGLDQEFYERLTTALTDKVVACGSRVPVVTGFFGKIEGGLLNRIGRGYTDLCAALVAVGLHAEELQVWKEVDGIFTANPSKVPTAKLLTTITPEEAAELTFYGSEVIHPFTMEQVIRASIPIRIRNVMNLRNPGTLIKPDPALSTPVNSRPPSAAGPGTPKLVRYRSSSSAHASSSHALHLGPKRPTAVTIKHKILVLNVLSNKRSLSHGFYANIFSVLDRWRLSIDLISTSEVHVSMALHSESALVSGGGEHEHEIVNADLRGAVAELQQYGTVDLIGDMAILSLVGRQMKNMTGVAGKMFSVLGENDVNIEMISQGASEINISCVIEERDADRAINILHTNLFTFLD